MVSVNDSADAGRAPVPYVCLPGSRFTGSTLIGAILNEHPDCASVGSAAGLVKRTDLTTYRCSCGELFRQCEFWQWIAERTRELGHPVNVYQTDFWNTHLRASRHRLVNAALVRSLRWNALSDVRDAVVERIPSVRAAISSMAWHSWSLAVAVLERSGKSVFVDTTRDHQRPKYLSRFPIFDVKVIHLVRDPRAGAASIMKHTGTDVATAARQWTYTNSEANRARQYLPERSWMLLHYEDLCADPAGVLDRISDFLGVRRASFQEGFRNPISHVIGNKTRLSRVKQLSDIREDLSWQTKLGSAELSTIARISGSTSHRLGYSWP